MACVHLISHSAVVEYLQDVALFLWCFVPIKHHF
jgi:hypothetical protein